MSDLMLEAVLRMPIDLWDDGAIDKLQRHSRYIQAADELAALKQELKTLREQNGNPAAWLCAGEVFKFDEEFLAEQFNKEFRSSKDVIHPLYLAAPVPAREGWKLVPIEPTEEMLEVYRTWHREGLQYMDIGIYKAMLEAAPKDPS